MEYSHASKKNPSESKPAARSQLTGNLHSPIGGEQLLVATVANSGESAMFGSTTSGKTNIYTAARQVDDVGETRLCHRDRAEETTKWAL